MIEQCLRDSLGPSRTHECSTLVVRMHTREEFTQFELALSLRLRRSTGDITPRSLTCAYTRRLVPLALSQVTVRNRIESFSN